MATALAHPTTDPTDPATDSTGPISATPSSAAKTAKTPPADPTPIRADLTPAAQQRLLLQDRAWELYCQGERSPAIAAALGVPARTVRDWLRAIRTQLAPVSQQQRAQQQALAVERQRSVLAAAWDGFHTDRERQEQLYQGAYDHLTRRTTRPAPASAQTAPAAKTAKNFPASTAAPAQFLDERYARPRDTTHPVQYLRLALTANREMARLLGLYDRHSFPHNSTPDAPTPPTSASDASATPAESAAAAKTAKTAKITTKVAAKTAKKSPALTHRQRRSKEIRRLHTSARPLRQ